MTGAPGGVRKASLRGTGECDASGLSGLDRTHLPTRCRHADGACRRSRLLLGRSSQYAELCPLCSTPFVLWSRGFFDAGTQRVQRSTGTYDPAGSRYATGRNITRLYATLRNWGTQHGGTQQTPQNATIYATYATNTDANATLYASADDPGAGHGRRTQNLGRLGSNRSADGWRYADTWPPWSTAGPATTRWPGWIGGSNTQGTQLGTQLALLTGTRTQLAQTQHATPAQRDATNW